MLNVNSIQDRLAGMSLPQLQQYAQLHKDDPYIVTMAMHVASMKRKMATAEQGQPTPPQPPVVDQAIAQMAPPPQQAPRAMLPEEQGIGALPERSLAKMAGGGIVAFEEGGEVERYAEGDLVGNKAFIEFLQKNGKTVRDFVNALPSEQAAMRAQFAGSAQPTAAPSATPAAAAALPEAATAMGAGQLFKAGLGAVSRSPVGAAFQHLFMTSPEEVAILKDAEQKRAIEAQSNPNITTRGQLQALDSAQTAPGTSTAGEEYRNRAIEESAAADAGMYPQRVLANSPTSAAATPEMSALQALAAGQKQPGAAGTSGVASLVQTPEQYKAMMDKFRPDATKVKDPFAKEAEEAGKLRIDAATQERDQAQKDIEALGEFGKDREARLKARELKLAKQEGENTGLALMNAGFAMMAGDSQYALQNIGKGAQVGTKSYVEGQEKLNAARERLDEAYSKLEEVRRGEKVANAREMRRLNTNIKVAEADVKDKGVAALRTQLGVEEDKAKEMANAFTQDRRAQYQAQSQAGVAALNRQVQAQIALAEIGSRERVAAMPGQTQRLYEALGGGNLEEGFKKAKELEASTKKSLPTLYNEWLKSNPTAAMEADGGLNKFLKSQLVLGGMGNVGFTNPGGNATVLKPKQ